MAIALTVENNNLLNAWQRVMIEQITTFNQISGVGAPLSRNCEVYIQPDEREPIARALDSSIKKIARLLNYWPRPKWFADTLSFGSGVPMKRQYFQTNPPSGGGSWKLIEFGQRAATVIQAGASVTYSDVGSYGVNNTATITVAAPAGVTDPNEIQIFFRVADGAPGAGDTRYQIEPALVTLSGGNFIITADRSLFVSPTVWAAPYVVTDPNRTERNAANNANASTSFVTAVDVYRVYNSTTTQIEVLDWNNAVLETFDAVIVDAETGLFTFYDNCWAGLWCYCSRPTRLRLNYRAGLGLFQGFMDAELEEAIVRLANVLMPVELCPFCAITKNRWEQDRMPAVRDRISLLSQESVNNAFGYVSWGSTYAFRTAVDRAITSGGKITRSLR